MKFKTPSPCDFNNEPYSLNYVTAYVHCDTALVGFLITIEMLLKSIDDEDRDREKAIISLLRRDLKKYSHE